MTPKLRDQKSLLFKRGVTIDLQKKKTGPKSPPRNHLANVLEVPDINSNEISFNKEDEGARTNRTANMSRGLLRWKFVSTIIRTIKHLRHATAKTIENPVLPVNSY